jgi:hypothetical protein
MYARGFSDAAYTDVSGARGALVDVDGVAAAIELATGLDAGFSRTFVCVVFHRVVNACDFEAL